nr:GerAB/ArcD/ProY family transporter [Desulforamulus aquiferis]
MEFLLYYCWHSAADRYFKHPHLRLKTTEASLLPALMMVRSIEIGFITRMDPFMMTIWFTGFLSLLQLFLIRPPV